MTERYTQIPLFYAMSDDTREFMQEFTDRVVQQVSDELARMEARIEELLQK